MRMLVALPLLLAAAASGQEQQKPRCTAAIQGQFWPEEANHDPKVRRETARTGELEVCSSTMWSWRYRWERVTVNVRQPDRRPSKPQTAAGESSAN